MVALSAPSATAADTTVQVGDDFFSPRAVQIDPGNTITWEWVGLMGNHSVTTRPDQTESFDSDPGNDSPRHAPGSAPFTYRFDRVGVTRYFCKLHPVTMTGTVTVGTPPPDATAPSIDPGKPRVRKKAVSVRLELNEPARVELTLASAARPGRPLRIIRKQLGAGRRAITLARAGLRPGRYLVKLTAEDDAGNTSGTARTSFRLKPRPRR